MRPVELYNWSKLFVGLLFPFKMSILLAQLLPLVPNLRFFSLPPHFLMLSLHPNFSDSQHHISRG